MSERERVEKALKKYRDKFGESFPAYYFIAGSDINGMLREIKRAIETGKPYEPELKQKRGRTVAY